MLTIRTEQVSLLGLSVFESRLMNHVRTYFPTQSDVLGETTLRRHTQEAVSDAASFGITDQRGICTFLNITMILGAQFYRDSSIPWAAAILSGPPEQDGTNKPELLYQTAVRYLMLGSAFR